MSSKHIIIVAGGTAGHILPAQSIGNYLQSRGNDVFYVSGKRVLDYKLFKNFPTLHLNGQALLGKSIFGIGQSVVQNLGVFIASMKVLLEKKPHAVLGCGGYICGPVMMSAFLLGIPIFLLEENAVMGFTNRLLAPFCERVFLHFGETLNNSSFAGHYLQTGIPIREEIKQNNYSQSNRDKLNVLVFGGSLGALEINNLMLDFMQYDSAFPISIRHQTGIGKDQRPPEKTGKNVEYVQVDYIEDMAKAYNWANVIIARSGAMTVAELAHVKRPCILIPLGLQSDRHQLLNAMQLKGKAQYPVFISSGKELGINGCDLLKKMLFSLKNYDGLTLIEKSTDRNDNPVEVISSVILKVIK